MNQLKKYFSKKNDSPVKLFEPNIDINSEVYLEQYIKKLGEDVILIDII